MCFSNSRHRHDWNSMGLLRKPGYDGLPATDNDFWLHFNGCSRQMLAAKRCRYQISAISSVRFAEEHQAAPNPPERCGLFSP